MPTIVPPRYLEQYTSLSGDRQEGTRRTIADSEAYLPSRSSFNDPLDCMASMVYDASPAERQAFLAKVAARRLPQFDPRRKVQSRRAPAMLDEPAIQATIYAKFQARIDKLGILCLSSTAKHLLLWSHYAKAHTGLCLGFRTDRDIRFAQARKVAYSREYLS